MSDKDNKTPGQSTNNNPQTPGNSSGENKTSTSAPKSDNQSSGTTVSKTTTTTGANTPQLAQEPSWWDSTTKSVGDWYNQNKDAIHWTGGAGLAGALAGFLLTKSEEGETPQERMKRRLKNALILGGMGMGTGYLLNSGLKGLGVLEDKNNSGKDRDQENKESLGEYIRRVTTNAAIDTVTSTPALVGFTGIGGYKINKALNNALATSRNERISTAVNTYNNFLKNYQARIQHTIDNTTKAITSKQNQINKLTAQLGITKSKNDQQRIQQQIRQLNSDKSSLENQLSRANKTNAEVSNSILKETAGATQLLEQLKNKNTKAYFNPNNPGAREASEAMARNLAGGSIYKSLSPIPGVSSNLIRYRGNAVRTGIKRHAGGYLAALVSAIVSKIALQKYRYGNQ